MTSSLEIPAPTTSRMWKVIIVCAWIIGLELWFNTDWWLVRSMTHLTVYAAAIAACFIKPVRDLLFLGGRQFDRRGRVATPLIFLLVTLLSILVLYQTAVFSRRTFSPVMHDEFSYLLQATMLAHGHLSMPAHPLGDFFDTFYVITDRAYASQYFPGAAMLFVPGVWLGLAGWVMPLIIAGAAAGMMFLVIRELFDGLCGLASVVILCGVLGFRFLSIVPIAQVPALLLGLTATFATLRWIATRKPSWIIACGAAIGWAAITRPLDAIVYAVPLGVLILFTQYRAKVPARDWGKLIACGVIPLLPFLALQLTINHRVTGNVLQTPFSYYAQRDLPGTAYGFHPFDPARRPASSLPEKNIYFDEEVVPMLRHHTPGQVLANWFKHRAKATAGEMVGDMLLFIPVPAGLLCLRDPRRWVVVSFVLVWCVLYSFYAFSFAHYYVAVLPSVPVLIFAGFESIWRFHPSARDVVRGIRVVLPAAIAIMAMPQIKRDVKDQFVDCYIEEPMRRFEQSIPEPRSIILVRWGPQSVASWELVYNIHDSWPDDARVIRAHDLGAERNIELYRYYAKIQPDRAVYLHDRATETYTRLGTVVDLANTPPESAPSTRP